MRTLFLKKLKTCRNNLQAGVTLIEMIVVVAIIALVSSVILFNYSDFSTNVSLRNLSQEVALAVRKSQTYATSVRTIYGTNLSSSSFSTYGIYIKMDNQKQFTLFADIPDSTNQHDYVYTNNNGTCGTPSENNECIENFSINTADKISDICYFYGNNQKGCASDPGDTLNITFTRPNPDARICFREECYAGISAAEINLISAKGATRSVTVYTTGQISVK